MEIVRVNILYSAWVFRIGAKLKCWNALAKPLQHHPRATSKKWRKFMRGNMDYRLGFKHHNINDRLWSGRSYDHTKRWILWGLRKHSSNPEWLPSVLQNAKNLIFKTNTGVQFPNLFRCMPSSRSFLCKIAVQVFADPWSAKSNWVRQTRMV